MKKLLLILIALPMIGFGQCFENTYGVGYTRDGQQTTDGGYVCVDYSGHIIKTNHFGDTVWTHNSAVMADVSSIEQTSDGGYILSGFNDVSGFEIVLAKLDSLANTLWTQYHTGQHSQDAIQTTDGGYLIRGMTFIDMNPYVIKTDSIGNFIWDKIYSTTEQDVLGDVEQTTDGGYIIIGSLNSLWTPAPQPADIWLLKTDGNGDTLWTNTYGGTGIDRGYSVQQTTDGGYIITGFTESFGNGNQDVYLIKTDGNGIEQWNQTFGGTDNDWAHSVQQTTDGGYIIIGETESFGNGDDDVYLIKTDSSGNQLWNRTFGGNGSDRSRFGQQTSDGGYFVGGYTNSFVGAYEAYMIKTDMNGDICVSGCTDSLACNYSSLAIYDDSSCVYPIVWQQSFSICDGDNIFVGNSIYDTIGNYIDTLAALNGCDSIVYTNISIIPPVIWQQSFSICDGDSIVVGGNVYNSAGNYIDTLNTINGCDSIVYTNISITPPIIWNQTYLICDGDSIVVGSNIYDTAGVYMDTLNTSNGCDSVVQTYLMIDENTSSYDTLSVGASIIWNGMPLNVSGDYSATLINSVGCDSIANLNLTVTTTGISEIVNNKSKLIKITDMLGQETPYRRNTPLFYLYDDGTVEKRIVIE